MRYHSRRGGAIKIFTRAWKLLPEPKEQWEAATWILAALGDAHFLAQQFTAARDAFSAAMAYPDAIGNPFLHLRLGQTEFELGNAAASANELTRAFAIEGADIFDDEDPKYLAFLKTQIRPPSGGWES